MNAVPFVEKLLMLAIAAQVLLIFGLLFWLGRERVPRVMSGEIAMADIAVERTAYPLQAKLLANSFDNQFQLPVVFFVGALLVLHLGNVSWVEAALGLVFVALRYTHAAIHVTTNNVGQRFVAYTLGLAVLVVFWLWLVFKILLAPSI